jgi:hypothetical protein
VVAHEIDAAGNEESLKDERAIDERATTDLTSAEDAGR